MAGGFLLLLAILVAVFPEDSISKSWLPPLVYHAFAPAENEIFPGTVFLQISLELSPIDNSDSVGAVVTRRGYT